MIVPGFKKTAAAAVCSALAAVGIFISRDPRAIIVSASEQSDDVPPVVKITTPKGNTSYSWNSLVHYNVVVTYQGRSTEYQEIPANSVLLKTTYVADVSSAAGKTPPATSPISPGLLNITNATCLGCHQFKAKSTGPSFAAIGERYSKNQQTLDLLSQHILEGSTGVWGPASMPAQRQLTSDELRSIASWIMSEAADPNVNYYVGTEGSFRMEASSPGPQAGMLLNASYTDRSSGPGAAQAPHGEDNVLVAGK